jgi:hypothetical protein
MAMKVKMTVIIDSSGKFLGALRTDPIALEGHTVRAWALQLDGQKHYEVEIDEHFMQGRSPLEVEQQFTSLLSAQTRDRGESASA